MKYLLVILVIILALTCCPVCKADDSQAVHDSAHLGISYLANDLLYRFAHNGLGIDNTESLIFAGSLTMFGGFLYKNVECINLPASKGLPGLGRSMLFDGIGVGLNVTIHLGDK